MKLIQHLPPRLAEIKEIADIQEAVEPELIQINKKAKQTALNRSPLRADLEGIQKWEEWLKITLLPGKTLEQRRLDILAKLNERLPFTLPQLYRMLKGLLGEGNFTIDKILGRAVLKVDINLKTGAYDSVFYLLQHIVPAHVFWILRSYFDTPKAKSTVGAFMYFGQEITLNPYEEKEFETGTHNVYASAHLSMEINKWQ